MDFEESFTDDYLNESSAPNETFQSETSIIVVTSPIIENNPQNSRSPDQDANFCINLQNFPLKSDKKEATISQRRRAFLTVDTKSLTKPILIKNNAKNPKSVREYVDLLEKKDNIEIITTSSKNGIGHNSKYIAEKKIDCIDENENSTNIPLKNEENFAQETENVVQSFFVATYERDNERHNGYCENSAENCTEMETSPSPCCLKDTPIIPEFRMVELSRFLSENHKIRIIGHRLALIGDELDAMYGRELDLMVTSILPGILSFSTDYLLNKAYEVFQNVAKSIFGGKSISWCRIVALLSFGYRLGIALFRQGVKNFLNLAVKLITRYLIGEKISRWIQQNGGWTAAQNIDVTGYSENGCKLSTVLNELIWIVTTASAAWFLIRRFLFN